MLRKIKKFIKFAGLDVVLPSIYKVSSRKPVVDKVLFIERVGKEDEISNNFKLIMKLISETSRLKVDYFRLRYTRVTKLKYAINCIKLVNRIAKSRVIFVDDASDVLSCIDLREETKIYNLWHACGAFKKFGMSTADKIFGGSRESKLKHPFYENLTLVTVSSEAVVNNYIEAMALDKEPNVVKALGVSRTDLYFSKEYQERSRQKVRSKIPDIKDKQIILYAPTFRGRVTTAESPSELQIEKLFAQLQDRYVLLIKRHPFVHKKIEINEELRDFAFDVSDDFNIEELMMASDLCITDYSSLVFEYSLLDRPMIFFCFDLEEYDDWRGFYYDYDELTPGPKCKSTEDVISSILEIKESDSYIKKREAFRNRFMGACDGKSTERIWDYVKMTSSIS